MTRTKRAERAVLFLLVSAGSVAWALPVHAQVQCGSYGLEARPQTATSCPGGTIDQSCTHSKLDAALIDCSGNETGTSCTWISEVYPEGGCTTCEPLANQCSVRICAPSVCGSGSYPEVCDGFDNDGGGTVDEGCPSPDFEGGGLTRVSQVDAASGAFVPARRLDVHYAGSTVPLTFSRVYTSLDLWPYDVGTRLGAGWFHTFDERLFDGSTFGAPSSSSSTVIHRVGARGRRFTCANGTCTTNDGSLDTLVWNANGFWSLEHADGVTTDFHGSGPSWKVGALWQKKTTRGQGWTVHYTSSGSLEGHIAYVEDHLARTLTFDWEPAVLNGAPPRLVGLRDESGVTLATFGYDLYARLTAATSAAGEESYRYWVDASGRVSRLLTEVTTGGTAAVTVSYDAEVGDGYLGRVRTIVEAEASLRFRYRAETRNACATAAESTMIVDRSTSPVGQSSCTDDATGDSWCEQQAGMPAVCDGGICRAIACQRYGDLVNGAGEDRVTAITGNCPCAGISSATWTSAGTESPRRIAHQLTRDSKRTTYAYDTRGRVVARCDKDTDTSVTTTSSSCPSTGTWNAWEYASSAFPTFVTKQRGRSRLDAAVETSTALTYDATHPELVQIKQAGLTRDAATDSNITETQTTGYLYDTSGRLTRETLPAGEVTSYTYSTLGGNGYGLLATAERWLDSQGQSRLVTSFSSYTTLGRPGTVTDPSTAATTYAFAYGGMRLTSRSRSDETTSYTYDSGGRLQQIVEPSGRRTRYSYDSLGRIQYVDIRDADASVAADRTEYVYDEAGRRTNVIRRRLDGQGAPGATEWELSATYDEHGHELTRKYGARAAIQYQLDPNDMGRIEKLTREDGDQVTMSYDAFGRELEYRRWITGSTSGAYLSSYGSTSGNEQGQDLPSQITDPHSVARNYVYDDFGRLVRSQSNDYGTIRWEYASGRLVERHLGNGKYSLYSYDALGRLTQVNHDAGSTGVVGQDFKYVWDNGGNVQCAIAGSTCPYRRGRLAIVQMEYAPGSFWDLELDYGAHGRLTAERWPSSRQTNYTWDGQGRLLRTSLPVPTSDKIRYEYDATTNDGEDPSELRRIVHELTAGTDYLVWARNIQHDSLGRQLRSHFADRADGTQPSIDLAYNTDGTVNRWRVRRRSSTSDVDMVNRTYTYWPDGQAKGWSSTVGADPGRTFFWDGANRLTCAASSSGLSSCPTGSSLLESYTYDLHENRDTKTTPAGLTDYYNPGANNQFWDEYPPNHTIWYGYDSNMFGGRSYDVHQSVSDSNQRNYYYYVSGGLRSISMHAPGAQAGTYDSHTFTLVYDHRGRPIYITDKNNTTAKERREQLYWDIEDRLIERVITPDAAAPSTYSVDIFAHMESATTGWMRLEYVNGGFQGETRRYVVRDPAGLVSAVVTFTGTGSTQVVYAADYQPFGEVRASSGSIEPALGQASELAIVGSAARIWSGQSTMTLRSRLSLSSDRVHDSRVGAFLEASRNVYGDQVVHHPYGSLPPPRMNHLPADIVLYGGGLPAPGSGGIGPSSPGPAASYAGHGHQLPGTVLPPFRVECSEVSYGPLDQCGGVCPVGQGCCVGETFIHGECKATEEACSYTCASRGSRPENCKFQYAPTVFKCVFFRGARLF